MTTEQQSLNPKVGSHKLALLGAELPSGKLPTGESDNSSNQENIKKWFPKVRLRRQDKAEAKRRLAVRDGAVCVLCGTSADVEHLELDHINENPGDNRLENLRLAHHSCNITEYQRTQREIKMASLALSYHGESEMNRGCEAKSKVQSDGVGLLADATERMRAAVDYSRGSVEMQVSELTESAFRNWIYAYLKTNGRILRVEAVTSGAEIAGCSVQATYRYLSKMISAAGALDKVKDPVSHKIFVVAKPATADRWCCEKSELGVET